MKALKTITPIEGVLGALDMALQALQGSRPWREQALSTTLPTHEIDTCCPPDMGVWETGVKPKGKEWVIVEQYTDAKAAKIGHEEWVAMLTAEPHLQLEDINEWGNLT